MTIKELRRKKSEGLIEKRKLLDSVALAKALAGMAQQIARDHLDLKQVVLVGIRTGGAFLAERLCGLIKEQTKIAVPCGVMDITLYRDDVFNGLAMPEVGSTELPCSLQGKDLVLVDDVLYTGRTIRAALEEIMEFGRPRHVRLAVLIDRGCRELPIQADYVGLAVKTTLEETIRVLLREMGEPDEAVLCAKGPSL